MGTGMCSQKAAGKGRAGECHRVGMLNSLQRIEFIQPSGNDRQPAADDVEQCGRYAGDAGSRFNRTGITRAQRRNGKT